MNECVSQVHYWLHGKARLGDFKALAGNISSLLREALRKQPSPPIRERPVKSDVQITSL